MSNYDINKNPELVKQLLEQYKKHEEESKNDPNSVLWDFKQELVKSWISVSSLKSSRGAYASI